MPTPTKNRTYVGYSSNVGDGYPTPLYDAQLVNQDLQNVFNTKKGECITDPTFGSIAWSMLFEADTPENLNIIQNDCMNIFNNESRVKVQAISVTGSSDATNPGFILQAQLLYVGMNVVGTFSTAFLQNLTTNDVGE